jgi:hypothetical protein
MTSSTTLEARRCEPGATCRPVQILEDACRYHEIAGRVPVG